MKILVTGANGHLGNNLCRALVSRSHGVRASVRSRDDLARMVRLADLPSLELVELDVRASKQLGIMPGYGEP
jgi:dihydroflavonol-4-reductase